MRILHTADLHLGRQFNGISLEEDHQAILDQILQIIAEHGPDALVIAGDVFDRAAPPATAVRQFNAFLSRVARETAAAVVMIAGNHDSGDRIGAMSIMTDARRALIRGPVAADEIPLILEDAHGPVAFSALPFSYEFAARECFQDEAFNTPEDVLRAQVAAARRHVPDDARWVVVAHGFVTGANVSEGERPLARVGGIETVGSEVFDGAHYVALGHLHRPQSAGAAHIRYSGAPMAFGFDEGGEAKSVCLVDLDGVGAATIQTILLRPLRGVREVRGKMADLVLNTPSNDFVKVILTDETPLIDPMKRLREIFPNACQLAYARDEKPKEFNAALLARIEVADPIQVIGNFLEYVRDEKLAESELELITSGLHGLNDEERAQ